MSALEPVCISGLKQTAVRIRLLPHLDAQKSVGSRGTQEVNPSSFHNVFGLSDIARVLSSLHRNSAIVLGGRNRALHQ